MATIKEIAKLVGVSIGTVDRVIHNRGRVNQETKDKIQAAIDELGYKPNTAAQALAVRKKKLKIVFIIPERKLNPFFQSIRIAAENKARELEEFGVQVIFVKLYYVEGITFCIEDDIISMLEEADGLVCLGAGFDGVDDYLAIMKRRRKPVVFYNMKNLDYHYLAYVGCDYVQSGRLAAGLSALAGGSEAKVCVFSQGLDIADSYCKRMEGFQAEVEKSYPKMQIVARRDISINPIDNFLTMQQVLEEFPDTNVVYVVNPANYQICEAVNRADTKKQIKVITNDIVEGQDKMIEQGIIAATVCQEPDKQGAESLDILFRYLAFGEKPQQKMCYTNLSIHIAQNIG